MQLPSIPNDRHTDTRTTAMRRLLGAATAAVLLQAQPALAARPLNTDDADVKDAAVCETTLGRLRVRGQVEATLTAGCGVGWRTELGVGASDARLADGQRLRGAQLGAKVALLTADEADPDGLRVGLNVLLGATREPGASWQQDHSQAALIVSHGVGKWGQVDLNLGHAREIPSRLVSTVWGLSWQGPQQELSAGGLAPVAEFYGDDREPAWVAIGLRWALPGGALKLDISGARRLRGEPTPLLNLGLTATF